MRQGFTLIEVVISLILLEIGLVGAFGLLTVASRTLAHAERLAWATVVAETVIDSLDVAPTVENGHSSLAPMGAVRWTVLESGVFSVTVTRDQRHVLTLVARRAATDAR